MFSVSACVPCPCSVQDFSYISSGALLHCCAGGSRCIHCLSGLPVSNQYACTVHTEAQGQEHIHNNMQLSSLHKQSKGHFFHALILYILNIILRCVKKSQNYSFLVACTTTVFPACSTFLWLNKTVFINCAKVRIKWLIVRMVGRPATSRTPTRVHPFASCQW